MADPKKGRSQELIDRRNRKLVERYHHLTEIERRRFDDAVFLLSNNEFFLAEFTINKLIKDNLAYLDDLCAGKKIFKPLNP